MKLSRSGGTDSSFVENNSLGGVSAQLMIVDIIAKPESVFCIITIQLSLNCHVFVVVASAI